MHTSDARELSTGARELSTGARRIRKAAVGVALAALVAGTLWGDDHHFPFGPFRMYSTTNEISGTIQVLRVRVLDETGREELVRPTEFGLRPAELDGRHARIRRNPGLLAALVDAYESLHPGAPEISRIQLVQGFHQLRNRRPVSYSEHVLATYEP